MKTLTVENVAYNGQGLPFELVSNRYPVREETLDPFTFTFHFGRSYLLACQPGRGGWAISWMASGALMPFQGRILLDDRTVSSEQLRHIGWCVRHDEIRRFGRWTMRVARQIQYGLRRSDQPCYQSEDEVKSKFMLTDARFHRYLRQFGNEAWSASPAIGIVNGRRIMSYPHVDVHLGFIEDYADLWLPYNIRAMTACGALVLIPARPTPKALALCDEVIELG